MLTTKTADLLIAQIGLALKSSLEVDGLGSRFYTDSMATALSAHLLRYYSIRNHQSDRIGVWLCKSESFCQVFLPMHRDQPETVS